MADPGFARGGVPIPRKGGGANIRFCQIFPKTAWNWKNSDWGASKILLCRSASEFSVGNGFHTLLSKLDFLPLTTDIPILSRICIVFYWRQSQREFWTMWIWRKWRKWFLILERVYKHVFTAGKNGDESEKDHGKNDRHRRKFSLSFGVSEP